jgi:Protein of unknown function (DUF3089)
MRSARFLVPVVALLALSALAAVPGAASAKTVWLCKPGLKSNPCEPGLNTTRFNATGEKKLGVDKIATPKRPPIDCFYVYPTVSDEKQAIADKKIDAVLRSIALYQAARYSELCKVYAPVYRQNTLASLLGTANPPATPEGRKLGPQDVAAAFKEYLKKYNKGRGFVLIGHSQGSFVLRQLMPSLVDRKPSVRKKLISAILLGGNVLVKQGEDAGGDFENIGACRKDTQLGCVMAFSTFGPTDPPANAIFGRTSVAGDEVLCTNPAKLGGGSAPLASIFPSEPFAPGSTIGAATLAVGIKVPKATTPWISVPGAYKGACVDKDGADVLDISPLGGAPVLNNTPDPTWGLHLVDANIALGNLVDVVRTESAAYAKQTKKKSK